MMHNSRFPYSLNFSLGSILLMLILMLLLLNSTIGVNSLPAWIIYGFFALIFLFLIISLIVKRLVPALKGDIALELDEYGLNDYIRDVCINWIDIENISLVRGRSALSIRIELKWESEYGSILTIPLRWIKGKDADIFDAIMHYYNTAKHWQNLN
jgi:uncharacterized membrane protein YhdT